MSSHGQSTKRFIFKFFLSNARCFVPMDLCFPYRTIGKLNPRIPLALSPPSWAIHLPQTGQFANRTARRERFRAGNLTADLEEHSVGILSVVRAGTPGREHYGCRCGRNLGGRRRAFGSLAGTQGFEPRYADPESAVLPLDDVPTASSF